jgi:iron complex outermembrane recepter protein
LKALTRSGSELVMRFRLFAVRPGAKERLFLAAHRWLALPLGKVLRRVVLLSALASAAFASANSAERRFDIPAGDASVSLKLFVEQSGEQLVYLVDHVRGIRTNAVHGTLAARQALAEMLRGTPLRVYEDERSSALVVTRGAERRVRLPTQVASKTSRTPPEGSATPPSPFAPEDDRVVRLPTFSISSDRTDTYVGKEALSTTRTGVHLADVPQSVIVLNQAFIADLNPTILAKALSYVGGAQTGTISWSVDRYMMRGFVGEGDYVDGFRTQTDKNTDLNLIERVEIIKGPSAIFIANQAATVGGVINKISKSPTPYRVANMTVQAGRWDANRADVDLSGPLTSDRKLMYRLLLAGQDSSGYYDHTYEKRASVVPMLRYQFSRDTDVWIKFEKFDSRYSSYNGIPLDGRSNRIMDVPRTRNFSENAPLNWRTDTFWRLWGQFTTRLNDHLAIRVAGFDSADTQRRVESILTPTGGTIAHGVFTPQYVIPADYRSGQLIPRSTTAVNRDYQPRRELQNDYALNFDTGPVRHNLLIGGNLVEYPQETHTYSSGATSTAFSTAIDPFGPRDHGKVAVDFDQPPANLTARTQTFAKAFVLETASFFDQRLILSLGASHNRFAFSQSTANYNQHTGVWAAPVLVPKQKLYRNLAQCGAVFKPLPHVSVFYGYNKNFSSNGLSASHALLPPQEGEQREFGIKSTWLDEKLSISLNRFDVVQLNNSVPAFPQTSPPSNVLVAGTESRGFDGDFSATLGEHLEVLGSFAWFEATVPLSSPWNTVPHPVDGRVRARIPVNNVSERNFALWTRYKFGRVPLKGLSVGIGVNYLHKRAVTDNNNQVLYAFLPAQTLLDAMLAYETKRLRVQLNCDNVLSKDYIYAARSNLILVPGTPRNLRLSLTLKF